MPDVMWLKKVRKINFKILSLLFIVAISGSSSCLATKIKNVDTRTAWLVADLEEAKTLWNRKKSGLVGYDLYLRVRSYDSTTGYYVLKVRRGKENQIIRKETGKPPESRVLKKVVKLDVDYLFEKIERAIQDSYEGISIIYDLFYGFPSAIQFNPKKEIIEDDWEFITELTPYPEGFNLLED